MIAGEEKVLIRKKTIKNVIYLLLAEILASVGCFKFKSFVGILFCVLACIIIPVTMGILILASLKRKKNTCTCCNEQFDAVFSYCPYCGTPKTRIMSEDKKLHEFIEKDIDRFKYSVISDDSDADRRLMDDAPEDNDDNIDIRRAKSVIAARLESNQDFLESLEE